MEWRRMLLWVGWRKIAANAGHQARRAARAARTVRRRLHAFVRSRIDTTLRPRERPASTHLRRLDRPRAWHTALRHSCIHQGIHSMSTLKLVSHAWVQVYASLLRSFDGMLV